MVYDDHIRRAALPAALEHYLLDQFCSEAYKLETATTEIGQRIAIHHTPLLFDWN